MHRYWCYAFEGFHQRIKRIAKDSNYRNISKRIVEFFTVQFGLVMNRDGEERDTLAGLC